MVVRNIEMPSLAVRRRPHMSNRTRVVLAAVAVFLVGGAITAFTVLVPHSRAESFVSRHGCSEIPVEKTSDIISKPYGTVVACRGLMREAHWRGVTEASAYLLLDTIQGLVVVRVDYRDVGSADWTAYATEIDSTPVEQYLSGEQLLSLQRATAARGGLRPGIWTLRLAHIHA